MVCLTTKVFMMMKKNVLIVLLAVISVATACSVSRNTESNKKKVVLLDNFFNNEWKTVKGKQVKWHYLWDDESMGGFSQLGDLFKKEGAALETLADAPTANNLKDASIYIIADPDDAKETASPNLMTQEYADQIARWVKKGGVLVLFANDSSNCELDHFNILSKKFGITFNKDNRLVVQDPHFEQGEVPIPKGHSIFPTAENIYIKGICSVTATAPAEVVLKTDQFDVMAVARYGKGTVFALGDPWIYNEYIAHWRLPAHFQNDKAAADWVKWLLAR